MAALPIILAIGSSLLAAKSASSAGKIKQAEAETEASQIETAAAQREADRKDRLARAVASQSAGAGASGILFSGSPLTVLQEDIRRESVATERDVLQSRIGATSARTRGVVARKQARLAATQSLLQAGASAASFAGK